MTVLKGVGVVIALILIGLALFLGSTPWRVHGGRFVTEYLLLGGVFGVAGLIALALSLRG